MDCSPNRVFRLSWLILTVVLSVVALPGTRLMGQVPSGEYSSLRITVVSVANGKLIGGATLHFPRSDLDFRTDAEGHAAIPSLMAGSWQVEATAPGKAKVAKLVYVFAGDDNAVTFLLPEGGSVSGTITDARGNPVEGVGVNVYPGNSGNPIDSVKTNSQGRFKSDHLPLDQPLSVLFAGHDGYTDSWQEIVLPSAQRQGELSVSLEAKPPGGSIAGIVLDSNSKPIAAQVTFSVDGPQRREPVGTDATGAFRLDDIPVSKSRQVVIARAKGWAPAVAAIGHLGTREAPEQITVRMTEKGHEIKGRVVNEEGEPVGNVVVSAGDFHSNLDPRTARMTTGADGGFTFDSLPADAVLSFTARGYSEIWKKVFPLDGGDVTVVMQHAAAIVGKVVDADTGRAVPEFNITALHESDDEEFGGSRGEFRIDGTELDTKVTLAVAADGYPVQYFDEIAPTPGGRGEGVVIHLSKNPPGRFRFSGRMIDAGGKPLEGVQVRLVSYMPDSDVPKENRFNWISVRNDRMEDQRYVRSVAHARTDSHGAFIFSSIPGPEVDMAYWGDGIPQGRLADIGKLTAAAREHLEIRVPAPASLSGRINRQAYPGAARIQLNSSTDLSCVMDVDIKSGEDRYAFVNVLPGSYHVLIVGNAASDRNGEIRLGQIGTAEVQVKEREARQFDLGFGEGTGTR